MSAVLALRPAELEAAKRELALLTAPAAPVLPSPETVKAALQRLAPPPPRPAPPPTPPPLILPMPPPRHGAASFPPGERFVAALDAEANEERRLAREALKLEPITIVISDQQELRRIHELAQRSRSSPIPMLRRHLRGWSREQLDAKRTEQIGEPIPS